MAKRKPSKREAMLAAVNVASTALSVFYRRPDATTEDVRMVLGILYEIHIERGSRLYLKRGGE